MLCAGAELHSRPGLGHSWRRQTSGSTCDGAVVKEAPIKWREGFVSQEAGCW